jgi:hypothetical protein
LRPQKTRVFAYRKEERIMTKSRYGKGRLLRFEVLESRSFPSVVLPAVAAPPPAAHAAAGAIFISPGFSSPAAGNAAANVPGATGNLPNIVGSQGFFSPAAASAVLTAEAAFPATGGSPSSAIATIYASQQANLNGLGLPSLNSWLDLNV